MYRVRRWAVRHARAFELLYAGLEVMLQRSAPLLERIGYARLERRWPVSSEPSRGCCSIARCAATAC